VIGLDGFKIVNIRIGFDWVNKNGSVSGLRAGWGLLMSKASSPKKGESISQDTRPSLQSVLTLRLNSSERPLTLENYHTTDWRIVTCRQCSDFVG